METKELKIIIPDGYEIDRENSTLEYIKFKPKSLTYEDVAKSLFKNQITYIADSIGIRLFMCNDDYANPVNSFSKEQYEKLLALNKLINVAKYLNGDWKPNFDNNIVQIKWSIYIDKNLNTINFDGHNNFNVGTPYFKTQELAQQAVEILGEETIRKALAQV